MDNRCLRRREVDGNEQQGRELELLVEHAEATARFKAGAESFGGALDNTRAFLLERVRGNPRKGVWVELSRGPGHQLGGTLFTLVNGVAKMWVLARHCCAIHSSLIYAYHFLFTLQDRHVPTAIPSGLTALPKPSVSCLLIAKAPSGSGSHASQAGRGKNRVRMSAMQRLFGGRPWKQKRGKVRRLDYTPRGIHSSVTGGQDNTAVEIEASVCPCLSAWMFSHPFGTLGPFMEV